MANFNAKVFFCGKSKSSSVHLFFKVFDRYMGKNRLLYVDVRMSTSDGGHYVDNFVDRIGSRAPDLLMVPSPRALAFQ